MLRNGRVSAPGLAALATLSVLVTASWGCASRGGAASVRPAPAADDGSPAASVAEAVVVTGATLLSDSGSPKLLLSAAGPLAPTVYTRDEGRRIVVDLANVIASPGLEPPRVDGEVFSHVGMKSFQELGKPHLQFEFTGRVPLESRLGTEPGSNAMAISFRRKAEADAVQVASNAPASSVPSGRAEAVPAPEPEPIRVETLPTRTSAPPVGASGPSPSSGEPEILAQHSATGRGASRLSGVAARRTGESVLVTLSGNGEFSYKTFALTNPPRYVIDLTGVKNGAKKVQDVGDAAVTRVRVSQFKAEPEAVTRVVLDLSSEALPEIAQADGGLTLRFGGVQVASAGTSDRPATHVAAPSAATSPAPAAKPEEPPAAGSYEAHEEADLPGAAAMVRPGGPGDGAAGAAALAPATTTAASTSTEPATTAPAAKEVAEATTVATAAANLPAAVESTPAQPVPVQDVQEQKEARQADAEPLRQEKPAPVTHEAAAPARIAGPAAPATMSAASSGAAAPQIVPSNPEVVPAVEPTSSPRRRRPTTEDHALVEAAEALLLQQEGGSKKDLSNPYESKTIGGADKIYTGEPITLNLKDADIKDTLQRFSELTGLNIVLDPKVGGTVTVSLTDIPWDQALELILKINGLGYVLEGNVMRIAPNDKLANEERDRKKLLEAQELNRPVKTVVQKVSYAGAGEVAATAKSVMSPRGDIFVDGRSNTLIIKELPDYLPTVLDLIRSLDQPTPQVIIEARIVEATRNFSRNLGISWDFLSRADAQHGNTTGLVFPNSGSVDGAVSLGNGPRVLGFSLRNVLDTFRLDMALSAAEARGLVKIISTPKVQTQTNQAASIQSGFQLPVQTTVNNTTTVLYIDATLRLQVTPQITSEGTVILDVSVQKREPAIALNVAGGSNVPLTTRDAKTRLMIRDGGTAVIGGIFKLTSNDGQSMIPGLWKIPLLGNLFRNRTISEASDELMIFITPRIIKN